MGATLRRGDGDVDTWDSMSPSLVSVVIPTKNGDATLPDLLDGLDRQRTPWPAERVIVDSGSTDDTLGVVRAVGGCRIIEREFVGYADFNGVGVR